jgi:hypothetical protein
LVATLVIFGDSIFNGSEPEGPDQGQTASSPTDDQTRAEVAEAATTVLDTWSSPETAYTPTPTPPRCRT